MDFNQGIPMPLQQKDFDIQEPRAPVTPAKLALRNRFATPSNADAISNGQRNMGSLGTNRLEPLNISAGIYGGSFAQESTHGTTGIYSCTDRLQDLIGCDAVSSASCNQFQAHQTSNHATRPSTSTFSNSIHGWGQNSYMNLMASTHEAGPTKVPFYTPLMLSQIGGSLKMPVQQNMSVLNENVLLDHSLSSTIGNWTRTSQRGAFSPLIPNSLSEGKMNVNNVIPCPLSPQTMENNKYGHGWLPSQSIDFEDFHRSKRNTYEQVGEWQRSIEKQAAVCLSTTVVPHPLEATIPSFLASQVPFEAPIDSQQQNTEAASAVISSEKDIPQDLIVEEHINAETKGIDLNKTPSQKPKKKKHRPKVIREGKPKRTPKSTPPKSVTPKTPMKKEEKTSGKRKYVRKKKIQDLSENPSHVPAETADVSIVSRTKSARRRLNFDLETVEVRDGLPGCVVSVMHNEGCRAPEVSSTEISNKSSTKASMQHAQRTEIVSDNSLNGIQLIHQKTEHTRFQKETAPAYQACREGTFKTSRMQDECEIMSEDSNRSSQQSKVGSIYKEYYELARKSDHLVSANPETSQKYAPTQSNSNQMLNLLLEMTKIRHNLSKDVPTPEEKNDTKTYERVPHFHDVSHDDQYLPQGYKKQRTEVGQNNFDPNAVSSSVEALPSDWRKGHVVLDNAGPLDFIKQKEFMALEKQRSSDNVSSFKQAESKWGKQLELSSETQSLRSADHSVIRILDPNKSSDHLVSFSCNKIQEQKSCELQKYINSQDGKANVKRKPRRRVHKEQSQTLPLSCVHVDIPTSGGSGKKVPCTSSNCTLECQSSSNCTGSFGGTLNSGELVVKGDPLSDIIEKLKCLSINRAYEGHIHQTPNAIVPYNGGGVMVPFEGLDDFVKKRRTRPKVDLDPESNRVWNLLMGKQSSEVDEEMDVAKEKWWEEERRVFHGRVDSFIARMHLVQGDRRFSKWKGSVVDSVVGVFLTQNVSDHLSSSAFMALAARFPARCNNKETTAEKEESSVEQETCGIYLHDSNNLQKQLLGRGSYNCDSLVILEENRTTKVHESCGSNTGGCENNINGLFSEADQELLNGVSGIQVMLTRSACAAEAEDRWSVEDMASSQESVISSQNPSVNPGQAAHQRAGLCSSSSVEPETFEIRSLCSEIDSFTSFTELLHMADRIPLMKYDSRTSWFSQVDGGKSILDLQGDVNGTNMSMFTSSISLGGLASPPMPHHIEGPPSSSSRLMGIWTGNITSCHNISSEHSINDFKLTDAPSGLSANSTTKTNQQKLTLVGETASYGPTSSYCEQVISSQKESWNTEKLCLHDNLHIHKAESSITKSSNNCSHENQYDPKPMHNMKIQVESTRDGVNFEQASFNNKQNIQSKHIKERNSFEVSHPLGTNMNDDACSSKMIPAETPRGNSKEKKTKVNKERKTYEWDSLRRALHHSATKKERSRDTMDSVDWEAVRRADVSQISETIRERGMNNMLAERIKEFLDRLVRDHGSVDLEWLRDVEPDKAKDYLLSIRGLGLKSVECLRLLTLHHLAFPVDTNVGRICVRLGWVPLQPLPESLQLHLLELYPMLETIQKYLWPRLCKLDQRTLYELHYQLITFGKVFCTKSKPNCNACPMRGECKHFASAFASARLALPGPEVKDIVTSTGLFGSEKNCIPDFNPRPQPQIMENGETQGRSLLNTCEPIIEEPATPEEECAYTEESAIEDAFYEDPDEIPTIKLNIEEFTLNLQSYIQENNKEIQDGDMSKALVSITSQAASIPMPKLKNIRRLRTEHHVYQLPDSHPLLEGFDKREPDDPSPYLLAIWTPGETAQSTEPPDASCNFQETGNLCNKATCFTCNSIREAQAQTVRATILIPCRTAMRGSFPLNGTYFQVNEVFADHETSRNPIDVPRNWIWNLPRRTVYFGTSVPTIFKGLTTEEIQQCFWRGFVCVRGFDQTTKAPRPLYARLHFPASKTKNKKEAATAPTKAK